MAHYPNLATLKPLALYFKARSSTPTTKKNHFFHLHMVQFVHSPKHHRKFQKLAKLMETKKNKILRNDHAK
jgi:hypothetical protein